jgi:SnoaL-like domain
MDTRQVGARLVELCRKGRNLDCVDTLYSDDIVSVEPEAMGEMPAETKGKEGVRGKNIWFFDNHEIHSAKAADPVVHGDRFAVAFDFDVTPKNGPQAGKRNAMHEIAVYTVKDDRIVREEFFY